ncbi:tRNA 5-methylaminomethyl-2-thiouridine biosynthesis bifunctional protein MnmC [Borrelia miyamotoi]|uniref:FAD-binding oxidoreductase n=1 Tax=Borrelia miyamotoi TaxID=47466 RepID=A0AAP9CFG2_9SPIR|nr:FAD-binding oxidoreductase [Borrelia miyamotoi]AHH04645.1 D-amino acid dehydrogenase small subunit [Borrelia miyamotoi FR64b]ATQ14510.1 FAD-binding oxidoreductase [Borrelia miyamotoi]ATQ15695.1 FAD-binding oxidoreductase [Borrelia miyamotoi]ATQ16839.1 FAD-binding oxidoreductase [Borrelia miyamotoi]ATQ18658.1 FAD-binding oxidoreductase [Borrelia miyamotoi]
MEYEFAVIGGGIAGSTLTYEILQRKKSVILFDNGDKKATTTSGGLINPIMGRKMNIAWREPEIFTFAIQYYKEMEQNINCNFLKENLIFRPFTTKKQKEELILKIKNDENIRDFIVEIKNEKVYDFSNDNDGGVLIKGAILNTNLYIQSLKQYFIKHNAYIEAEINEDQIKTNNKFFTINKIKFKKLIFTRGYKEQIRGTFSYLPFRLAKGEILIIEIKGLRLKEIYNRHVSLIPLQDNKFYLGGTYEWENLNIKTNEWAKKELLDKLKKITNLNCKVIQHKAHIRPSTIDREPFIGEHPKHKNKFILNGFGTRGISMAAYLSKVILDYIDTKSNLPTYYDIKRHENLYNSIR